MAGRFDYADRGILDRTHLRFFTRRTLLALLARAGLAVDELRVTPVPLPLVVLSLAGVVGGLVTRGNAYLGRFSVHLIPVGAAITTILAAWVADRGARTGIGTPESESGRAT